ncbi:hypothetical protein LXA43DRAFT_1103650 [Ganoderma leucocontextum]|nr:hypothetical protein LXA43DRAFT_1103650 [Ganoderma leucocontextum]
MPNHSTQEKDRIRELTKQYLPSNLDQKNARRDCPHDSLHHHQASYGQSHFANIGLIFEYVRQVMNFLRPVSTNSDRHSVVQSRAATLTAPPMSVKRRADLLSELETSERGSVTWRVHFVYPIELHARCLCHSMGSTGHTTPQMSGSTSSASKGPGRPRRDEFEVTVYEYLRNGTQVTTAKAVGHLTRRKQIEFKFYQDAVAKAFNFDLRSSARPKFELYLPLGDQWTDRIMPMVLIRGQPILVRGEGVRDMPGFDHLKPVLNPPFDPNGVRPLSTFADYVFGFPSGPPRTPSSGKSSGSRTLHDATSMLANIFGGPPGASKARELPVSGPSLKRPRAETIASSSRKTMKSSSNGQVRVRAATPEDVIYLTDHDDTTTSKKGTDKMAPKGKGKAWATDLDEIIDLMLE